MEEKIGLWDILMGFPGVVKYPLILGIIMMSISSMRFIWTFPREYKKELKRRRGH